MPSPPTPGLAPHHRAPLPTHAEFQHDPNLAHHIARRLHILVDPLLRDQVVVPPELAAVVEYGRNPDRDSNSEARVLGEISHPHAVLHPDEFREFPLVGKLTLSPNTARYRFGLPHANDSLGLPIGQHVSLAAEIGGHQVMRSYTPVSLDNELGYFDLVVKSYEHGTVSKYLSRLSIGDTIKARGPRGTFRYTPMLAPRLVMIAGGSGITPMYQIIKASVLDNPDDTTELRLIYANVEEPDIREWEQVGHAPRTLRIHPELTAVLRRELDTLAEKSRGRVRVFYVLERPPSPWDGGVGYVTAEHISAMLEGEGAQSKALLCGPPPMISAMLKHLDALGFQPPRKGPSRPHDQIFLF